MYLEKLVCILGDNTNLTRDLIKSLVANHYNVVLIQYSPSLVTRNNLNNFNFRITIDSVYSNTYKEFLSKADFIIDLTFAPDIATFKNLISKNKALKNIIQHLSNNNPSVAYTYVYPSMQATKLPYFLKNIIKSRSLLVSTFTNLTVLSSNIILDSSNYIKNINLVTKLNKNHHISFVLFSNLSSALKEIIINFKHYAGKGTKLPTTSPIKESDIKFAVKNIQIINNKYHTKDFLLISLISGLINIIKQYYYKELLEKLTTHPKDYVEISNFSLHIASNSEIIVQCQAEYENGFK